MHVSAAADAGAVAAIPRYGEGGTHAESYERLRADRVGFVRRAYRQAGPIFRTWYEDAERIVLAGREANDFIWRRTELWDYPVVFPAFGEQMGPDHLNVLDGDAHRNKRSILKPAFDVGPAMRFLPGFNACCHAELRRAGGRGPVNLIEFWAETITRANTQTVAQADISAGALKRLVRWEHELLEGIFLGPARHAFYGRPEYQSLRSEAMALMDRIVGERLADPERVDDNFARVLRARREQPGGYPARHCLIDDLYYILVAGVENTARLITSAALLCAFAPEWQKRIQAELAPWDGQDLAALSEMATLKAVIMETHRLRPTVFFVPRHAAQEFEFGGCRVPAGTEVLHANVLCHFLEEFYADADHFRPDRFLENQRFVPRTNGLFGGGVHLCLGRNHTLMQTPVALAQLFKYCRVAFPDEPTLRAIMATPGPLIPTEIPAEVTLRPP